MWSFYCRSCGETFPINIPIWRCSCGGLLQITGTGHFDTAGVTENRFDMWRYVKALPYSGKKPPVSLGEGCTPLLPVTEKHGTVFLKHEQISPTGSFKDRGASMLISAVREYGIRNIVEDSSGNAGAAVAAYAAAAGIDSEIFIPESTPPAKTGQIEAFGSLLSRIPGSREDTALAAFRRAETCYYASHSWNPFFFHGTKTFAYEISEQLGWTAPDTVYIPCGNGTLLLGAYIGWKELFSLGIVKKIPKLIAVQSLACAPLYTLWYKNHVKGPVHMAEVTEKGVADGIAVSNPVRKDEIFEAVENTGGYFLGISNQEVIQALQVLLSHGISAEPTGAAAFAGYLQDGDSGGKIIVPVTGHGLKTAGKQMSQ